jgi:hypothetical protein
MATQVLKPARAGAEHATRGDGGHRLRLWLVILVVAVTIPGLLSFGIPYYRLPQEHRVADSLHAVLRPSGTIGLRLGQTGFLLMLLVYLYGIRKRWPWLRGIGNTRRWLDFHILMGITAPLLITLHSSFKFQGIAGVALGIMWAVVMSGFVGRYFYGQIPRTLNAAEISLKEMEAVRSELSDRLARQRLLTGRDLAPLFRIPAAEEVQRMSLMGALGRMFALDLARPFQVARLRRKSLHTWRVLLSLGGMLPSGNRDLEEVIAIIRKQSWLSMKIAFLVKAHAVFDIWHIVHRPFSYSLAVLAVLHVVTALLLGYF